MLERLQRRYYALSELIFNKQTERFLYEDFIRFIPGDTGKPTVLYYAPTYDYGIKSLGLSFEELNFFNALLHMRYNLVKVDSLTGVRRIGPAQMMGLLRSLVDFYSVDFVFMSSFKNDYTTDGMERITRQTEAITISWFSDDQWRYETHSRVLGGAVDLVVTTDRGSVEKYRHDGIPVLLSQWACNPFLYKNRNTEKAYDVCFIGQNYGSRARIVRNIRNKGVHVVARGRGWPEGRVGFADMIDIFNKSWICLNFSESSCDDKLQIKGRDFEALACGCALVTRSSTGIEEYLTPGKECVTYDSEGAVADVIVELLRDKEKLRTIAAAAAVRVSREHTWPHRFEEIFRRAKKRW